MSVPEVEILHPLQSNDATPLVEPAKASLMVGAGLAARLAVGAAALLPAACGGGGSGGGGTDPGTPGPPTPPTFTPPTTAEAGRLLTQGTFGTTQAAIDTVRTATLAGWVDNQIATASSGTHQAYLDDRLVQLRGANAAATLSATNFYESFWKQAATAPDQLRQRVALALSEIFVVSLADATLAGEVRGVAAYYDMLAANAFGNYRTLLEQVSLHPMMGIYLTHLANQKADGTTGRKPDENYAREVMQLMSIGVSQLNTDGTVKTDSTGTPLASYTPSDISELAKVFTGFSWYSPTPTANTFLGRNRDAESSVRSMIPYPVYHSTEAKTFLGVAIAAGSSDPAGDLKIALDTIFAHPNVGPFIGKQLIQRLVTSNPSPAYVGRVAAVFNGTAGGNARGDLAAVVKAVLNDSEARDGATAVGNPNFGKIREPVLRLANWMRAFSAVSTSGNWLVGATSANTSLGQSAMTAGSVFNFFRPGYSPPNTRIGAAGLLAPELQIVDEVTVAGYLNTMQTAVGTGIGTGSDVKAGYFAEVAVAADPAALVDRMNLLLTSGVMSALLRGKIIDAVTSIVVPASTGTNQATIDTALLNRSKLAVFLTMASPEYLLQR